MTKAAEPANDTPVRKSIVVDAAAADAFRLFTAGIDRWWPRSHHIGKSPMRKIIVEERAGGRCYTQQEDGTDCDWGSVLVWEPPYRFVFAWQINGDWTFQPDLARSSEVEVRFTPDGPGRTRVDLEHRYLSRHGAGTAGMRTAVDGPDGWMGLLTRYAAQAEQAIDSESAR